MPAPGLQAHLDVPLPRTVWADAATTVFVCGWCFHPVERVVDLWLTLDGDPQPVLAHGMPRLDPLRALHPTLGDLRAARDRESAEDPGLHSYASGFWGFLDIPTREAGGTLAVGLLAELAGGARSTRELGTVALSGPPATPVAAPGRSEPPEPLVAIAMATFEPPPELLTAQLDSIRAQTHENWICVISDDASSPERFAALQAAVAGDSRFVVSRSPRRRDFYLNFERALAMVPREAAFVALADQDDVWHPDKLTALLGALGDATLVFSDARVIDDAGTIVADTYWTARRPNHDDLLSLLVANSVTGAASLFPRGLLDDALPFPPAQFAAYHDHWLALCALACGRIAYVGRPLYDYVQHGTATLGHAQANAMPTLGERLRGRRERRERVRMWRMHYFVDACRLMAFARVLLMRLGHRMPRERRRVLEAFATGGRSPGLLARLAGRGALELTGRRTETLGGEWLIFRAQLWRALIAVSARERPQRFGRLDAVPPPDLAPRAGRRATLTPEVRSIAAKIAPLEARAEESGPARINVLVPTVDLAHFFGGYIGKFNLASRLAARGLAVRIVTVDPTPPLPRDWRAQVSRYAGLAGVFDEVEVRFGREAGPLEVGPQDRFIATTWWTAHIAADLVGRFELPPFLYLIQEYEPFTFPMGSYAALADASYGLPHTALFSSALLREWFRLRGLGVFAAGAPSWAFENAITDVRGPTVEELRTRGTRRLLFYARPEPHAARNLFELGVLGLTRALEDGRLPADWELAGIGAQVAGGEIGLRGGATLRLLPRIPQDAYAGVLRDYDVGVALMYTPHPSLVPIEMAAAGMATVTTTFENKTAEAMCEISPNILAAPATVDGIASAIGAAVEAAGDAEARVRGSDVKWSRSWERSFDGGLIDALLGALAIS